MELLASWVGGPLSSVFGSGESWMPPGTCFPPERGRWQPPRPLTPSTLPASALALTLWPRWGSPLLLQSRLATPQPLPTSPVRMRRLPGFRVSARCEPLPLPLPPDPVIACLLSCLPCTAGAVFNSPPVSPSLCGVCCFVDAE